MFEIRYGPNECDVPVDFLSTQISVVAAMLVSTNAAIEVLPVLFSFKPELEFDPTRNKLMAITKQYVNKTRLI
jgi:hypothetical protein